MWNTVLRLILTVGDDKDVIPCDDSSGFSGSHLRLANILGVFLHQIRHHTRKLLHELCVTVKHVRTLFDPEVNLTVALIDQLTSDALRFAWERRTQTVSCFN